MPKFLINLFIFAFIIAVSSASANYHCKGKVQHFGLDGALHVSNGFGVHTLCGLAEAHCSAWTSVALAAKMADRALIIYYRNDSVGGNQSAGTCKSIGSWVKPADTIYYVQVD